MDYEYIFAHLTIILTLAAASGILTGKLKQPVMIGYIIAGVLIGPSCFGLVASQEQVHFYSELGIILLLFVIGMELNIKSFLKMWRIPTLFTVIQVVGSSILAVLLSHVFGFSVYVSLLTAFFTCLSSTAAIVKVLEYLGESKTDIGYITIGILVSQDIVVVPMMLIIKECGKPLGISVVLELAFAIGLVIFMLKYLGKKEQIKLPINHIVPNQELIPVITLASVFIAATLVTLFGLSEAYGAFLAGLFIGNTQARQNVLNSIKPIQNVLLMVFFLSVGLMFDMKFLLQNWFIVLISLTLVTAWKIFFNSIILKMFSIELAKATSIGIILAQLGEFSLVLATVATQSGIIGTYGQKLIVCITALSLSISPLFIALSKKTRNLSFIGDNSANSIVKVIFSGRFSKFVEILIHRSRNAIQNQIEKVKSSRMQEKETVSVNIAEYTENNTTDLQNNLEPIADNQDTELQSNDNITEIKLNNTQEENKHKQLMIVDTCANNSNNDNNKCDTNLNNNSNVIANNSKIVEETNNNDVNDNEIQIDKTESVSDENKNTPSINNTDDNNNGYSNSNNIINDNIDIIGNSNNNLNSSNNTNSNSLSDEVISDIPSQDEKLTQGVQSEDVTYSVSVDNSTANENNANDNNENNTIENQDNKKKSKKSRRLFKRNK